MPFKVYVGNLEDNGDRNTIWKAFEKYGNIVDVWVARNPPGFAFVEFEDERDAEDAVQEMNGRRLCNMKVKVELSHGQRRRRGGGRGGHSDRRYDDRRRSPPPRRRSRSRSPYGYRERSPFGQQRYGSRRSRSRSPGYRN